MQLVMRSQRLIMMLGCAVVVVGGLVLLYFQNACVTVIHVPDDKYRLSARIVFQYLLTSQGQMYELKVRQV